MALQGEAVGRPFVLVGGIADAEVEGREILGDRLIDQVLQQKMTDAVAAELRVVGRKKIIEPAAPDEAEVRRRHGVADRQRRKMADRAEPARAHHLAIKALDAGRRQKIRSRRALVFSALELEQSLRHWRGFGGGGIDDEARLADLA